MKLKDLLKVIELEIMEIVWIRSDDGRKEVLAVVDHDHMKTKYDEHKITKIQLIDKNYPGLSVFVERS